MTPANSRFLLVTKTVNHMFSFWCFRYIACHSLYIHIFVQPEIYHILVGIIGKKGVSFLFYFPYQNMCKAFDIIQLVRSFEVYIKICQPENSDDRLGKA